MSKKSEKILLTKCSECKIDSMCNRARVKPCVMFCICVNEKYDTKKQENKITYVNKTELTPKYNHNHSPPVRIVTPSAVCCLSITVVEWGL
jgi:aspartate-semialdehyde dehydrogenase